MTPEPDTPPTSTPDSYPLGDLIHAALQSKEYLGEAPAGTGTLTQAYMALVMHVGNCSLEITNTELNLWTLQVLPPTQRRLCPGSGRPIQQQQSYHQGCSPQL